MENLGLQIIQAGTVVVTALFTIYKFTSELKHQSIEGLIKYSAYFESSDRDFVDSFLRPEIKRRIYKRVTGISFSYRDEADWLYEFFKGRLSWFYLSIVIPFLIIDKDKRKLTVQLDGFSLSIMTLCIIGFLDACLLLLLYSPLFSEHPSITNILVSFLCVLYFFFCLCPFLMLWAVKRRFLRKKINQENK